MATKYKTTGCAKFFLVLIVLAPLAYLGASYYNGEDGVANIKSIFSNSKADNSANTDAEDLFNLKNQLSKYQKDAQYFEKEMNRYRKELEACQNAQN